MPRDAMTLGRVPVLHGGSFSSPDEADTVNSARAVVSALHRLGYDSEEIALDLDLRPVATLLAERPRAIFNLVEAIDGVADLAPMVAVLIERSDTPYTGFSARALIDTADKVCVKRRLRNAGIPTPDWWERRGPVPVGAAVIVKAVSEHASLGLNSGSVMTQGAEVALERLEAEHRTRFFVERFVEGREFHLAVLGCDGGLVALPIQETLFDDLPPDRPRIVDYAAKWDPSDAAYHATLRRFGLEESEPELAETLTAVAERVWSLFDLRGYARIDFRVDSRGRPFVIDVNANPCLAPDAGYMAAATQAGFDFDDIIGSITLAAIAHPVRIAQDAA